MLYPSVGCMTAAGLGRGLTNHGCLNDYMISYRNSAWAAKAWLCRKPRFCNRKYLKDFENGFRDGYKSIADGGNGCAPAVCPQQYWGWQYQTADGQARMNAWFEGYPMGVQAAEEEGIGNWSQVRTNMPAPPHVNTLGMAPAGMTMGMGIGMGPAIGGLSDQSEYIPLPAPDPVASTPTTSKPAMAAKKAVPPPAKSSAKMDEPKVAQPKVAQPKSTDILVPEVLAPKVNLPVKPNPADLAPLAAPDSTPKSDPFVPQPNADPFGFN